MKLTGGVAKAASLTIHQSEGDDTSLYTPENVRISHKQSVLPLKRQQSFWGFHCFLWGFSRIFVFEYFGLEELVSPPRSKHSMRSLDENALTAMLLTESSTISYSYRIAKRQNAISTAMRCFSQALLL